MFSNRVAGNQKQLPRNGANGQNSPEMAFSAELLGVLRSVKLQLVVIKKPSGVYREARRSKSFVRVLAARTAVPKLLLAASERQK